MVVQQQFRPSSNNLPFEKFLDGCDLFSGRHSMSLQHPRRLHLPRNLGSDITLSRRYESESDEALQS